eukprot:Clim_evm9s213 gene=Clim_evmTU9s213
MPGSPEQIRSGASLRQTDGERPVNRRRMSKQSTGNASNRPAAQSCVSVNVTQSCTSIKSAWTSIEDVQDNPVNLDRLSVSAATLEDTGSGKSVAIPGRVNSIEGQSRGATAHAPVQISIAQDPEMSTPAEQRPCSEEYITSEPLESSQGNLSANDARKGLYTESAPVATTTRVISDESLNAISRKGKQSQRKGGWNRRRRVSLQLDGEIRTAKADRHLGRSGRWFGRSLSRSLPSRKARRKVREAVSKEQTQQLPMIVFDLVEGSPEITAALQQATGQGQADELSQNGTTSDVGPVNSKVSFEKDPSLTGKEVFPGADQKERKRLDRIVRDMRSRPGKQKLDSKQSYKRKHTDPFVQWLEHKIQGLCDYIPPTISPNLFTLPGVFMHIAVVTTLSTAFCTDMPQYYTPRCTPPQGMYAIWWITAVTAWVLDVVDGQHARNTRTQSPLRHYFDHIVDIFNLCCAGIVNGMLGAPIYAAPIYSLVLGLSTSYMLTFIRYYATGVMRVPYVIHFGNYLHLMFYYVVAVILGGDFWERNEDGSFTVQQYIYTALLGVNLLMVIGYAVEDIYYTMASSLTGTLKRQLFQPLIFNIVLATLVQIFIAPENMVLFAIAVSLVQCAQTNNVMAAQLRYEKPWPIMPEVIIFVAYAIAALIIGRGDTSDDLLLATVVIEAAVYMFTTWRMCRSVAALDPDVKFPIFYVKPNNQRVEMVSNEQQHIMKMEKTKTKILTEIADLATRSQAQQALLHGVAIGTTSIAGTAGHSVTTDNEFNVNLMNSLGIGPDPRFDIRRSRSRYALNELPSIHPTLDAPVDDANDNVRFRKTDDSPEETLSRKLSTEMILDNCKQDTDPQVRTPGGLTIRPGQTVRIQSLIASAHRDASTAFTRRLVKRSQSMGSRDLLDSESSGTSKPSSIDDLPPDPETIFMETMGSLEFLSVPSRQRSENILRTRRHAAAIFAHLSESQERILEESSQSNETLMTNTSSRHRLQRSNSEIPRRTGEFLSGSSLLSSSVRSDAKLAAHDADSTPKIERSRPSTIIFCTEDGKSQTTKPKATASLNVSDDAGLAKLSLHSLFGMAINLADNDTNEDKTPRKAPECTDGEDHEVDNRQQRMLCQRASGMDATQGSTGSLSLSISSSMRQTPPSSDITNVEKTVPLAYEGGPRSKYPNPAVARLSQANELRSQSDITVHLHASSDKDNPNNTCHQSPRRHTSAGETKRLAGVASVDYLRDTNGISNQMLLSAPHTPFQRRKSAGMHDANMLHPDYAVGAQSAGNLLGVRATAHLTNSTPASPSKLSPATSYTDTAAEAAAVESLTSCGAPIGRRRAFSAFRLPLKDQKEKKRLKMEESQVANIRAMERKIQELASLGGGRFTSDENYRQLVETVESMKLELILSQSVKTATPPSKQGNSLPNSPGTNRRGILTPPRNTDGEDSDGNSSGGYLSGLVFGRRSSANVAPNARRGRNQPSTEIHRAKTENINEPNEQEENMYHREGLLQRHLRRMSTKPSSCLNPDSKRRNRSQEVVGSPSEDDHRELRYTFGQQLDTPSSKSKPQIGDDRVMMVNDPVVVVTSKDSDIDRSGKLSAGTDTSVDHDDEDDLKKKEFDAEYEYWQRVGQAMKSKAERRRQKKEATTQDASKSPTDSTNPLHSSVGLIQDHLTVREQASAILRSTE